MTVVSHAHVEQHRAPLAHANPETARGAARDRHFADLALAEGDPSATARGCRRTDLRRVEIELVAPASDKIASFVIDAVLEVLAHGGSIGDGASMQWDVPAYTTSLDAARDYGRRVLPGFYLISGTCGTTGHASVGPDYDGPEGARLLREWPPDGVAQVGWHEQLPQADEPHREPRLRRRALDHQNERT
ncbi:hypothetical protein HNR00_003096 [Methylorubrum rhodinum]|uniref:Uncharacterized protein n=1 Tax=Methylorubrum rhodinum TaxID=29428 RepID=A0A840ZLA5_9HYPH|nr:hypothetical protein [Methylorubrum rhodinum]MBB5758376.1 hypothetical protein [Methylorubrum rhodinum]